MKLEPKIVHPFYPIWEYTLDIPVELTAQLKTDANWLEQADDGLKHPEGRLFASPTSAGFNKLTQMLIKNQTQWYKEIFDPEGPFSKPIRYRWPAGIDLGLGVEYTRDATDFSMPAHLDNRNIFAASVLNLANNNCGTQFYYQGELLYEGPRRKGQGVLFMNTEHTLHGVTNSKSPRYTGVIQLALITEPTYVIPG